MSRYRISGVVLPEGEYRDIWVVDGMIVPGPVANASTLATKSWIMPGFVDAHCHVGLDAHGGVSNEVAEAQALTDRDAGTLLIRDAGSPVDTHWMDGRKDLPKIIRAGRHIARPKRYIRNYAAEVEPPDLVAMVEAQVVRGDGWIKLVGDWIDRQVGDLRPLWPQEIAAKAIARAHELGARVTAHCFDEEAVRQLVAAGIDCIEHGTGLDEDTIAVMAERQVALVPTLVNIENFPRIAAQAEGKFDLYAAHMRKLYAKNPQTIRHAIEAGVPVYTGTDAGGTMAHGLIGQEIQMIAELSSNEYALGAGSWRARQWLGRNSLEFGSSADLVIFDTDPRVQLKAVLQPKIVMLNGKCVVG